MIKTNTHTIIKNEDINNYLSDEQIHNLTDILQTITQRRREDEKSASNDYYICNTNEPYADKVLNVILNGEKSK